jgi:UTP--glucose-1-phosphate uridylyltransferase
MSIKIAVIPVAGLGTKFLPATKAVPKEMLPIVDTPAIQLIIEEARAAGIEHTIFISARDKVAIENHFDSHIKLENLLRERKRFDELEKVRHTTELMRIGYLRQSRILGVGHAILQARTLVGSQAFAVFFPDDLVRSSVPCIEQLIEVHAEQQCSVVALEPVPLADVDKYGIIRGKRIGDRLYNIEEMVEKPSSDDAPSNLAIIGRYILTPEIFKELSNTLPGRDGEIQLTDALRTLLQRQKVLGLIFQGKRYDLGDRLGFLKATVEYALERTDIGPGFRDYLKELL